MPTEYESDSVVRGRAMKKELCWHGTCSLQNGAIYIFTRQKRFADLSKKQSVCLKSFYECWRENFEIIWLLSVEDYLRGTNHGLRNISWQASFASFAEICFSPRHPYMSQYQASKEHLQSKQPTKFSLAKKRQLTQMQRLQGMLADD